MPPQRLNIVCHCTHERCPVSAVTVNPISPMHHIARPAANATQNIRWVPSHSWRRRTTTAQTLAGSSVSIVLATSVRASVCSARSAPAAR
jgi:hypothetical protein